jgi:hypothetical protein
MVVSLPTLLVQDLPSQLLQILKLMKKEPDLPADLSAALDSIIQVVEMSQAQQSGFIQNVFKPAANFLPNLLTGVNRFLVTIFDGVFYLIGARDPYAVAMTRKPEIQAPTTVSPPSIPIQINNTESPVMETTGNTK